MVCGGPATNKRQFHEDFDIHPGPNTYLSIFLSTNILEIHCRSSTDVNCLGCVMTRDYDHKLSVFILIKKKHSTATTNDNQTNFSLRDGWKDLWISLVPCLNAQYVILEYINMGDCQAQISNDNVT